ncbi:hypothetical protein [Nostoc piscinale]|nr:hypothetical protein [Nostoc piscinale]
MTSSIENAIAKITNAMSGKSVMIQYIWAERQNSSSPYPLRS